MEAVIRSMQSTDIPAGMELCRFARWNQLEDDWREFLDDLEGGGRVAVREGAVIGTAAFLRYGPCFSWLSMMLVHPDARRVGIGRRLLEATLDALGDEACVRLDATALGEPLYRSLGFHGEYELTRGTLTVPPGFAEAVPKTMRSMMPADLPAVFAHDRRVFGADHSRLLASFYRRAPDLAWTAHDGLTLRGYCFGRPGYLYRQLGPVVAGGAAVARELAAGSLAGRACETIVMDVPRVIPGWLDWLQSAGFVAERSFLRMCRGQTQCSGDVPSQFAIAGPEFG